ncbi:MAG: hypothetical protein E5X88_30280 [Mesorhizobium sp.]|uniref:hypothetical protein n=2 Tax=Mesorhizobium sp. TaxID=1871066 RepID=UPI00122ABC8D|nr:hypothetical protein [Mesorhizobium sp.]TIO04752.1 MAG: hypothetical protein E5X88_30280 [Mesorhizobium sp.]TIP12196.1 MAG: hypothetical protein E5X73_13720 [Mesorhizobium sp.]
MMDGMAEKRLLERRTVDFGPLNVGARSRKSMALLTVLDIGGARDRSEDVNLHFHILCPLRSLDPAAFRLA